MELIQAALYTEEESDIEDSADNVEPFHEKTFKENKDLIKFGREHLNRIIKNKDERKSVESNRNTKSSPLNTEKDHKFFTLQSNTKPSEFINQLPNSDDSYNPETEDVQDIQHTDNQPTEEFEQISDDLPLKQTPKGKEWRGYEKCTASIYGDDVFKSIKDTSAPKLVSFNEELKSIHFNLPSQVYTTSDGHIIQNNQVRKTQKRKHQINWLAMEAQEHEFDLLQQTAHMRKSKRETQMKYGW